MPIDETNVLRPPAAFGPYLVFHQVGRGVLGPLFRTHDSIHDRLIAVKAITLDLVPEDVPRLAAALEDVAARPVDHRGAVNVLAAGQEGGHAYFATDYVAGESLELGLRRFAPLPLNRAVDLLRSLAEVIDAAWEAGVGHGALHPGDVFLQGDGSGIRVTGIGIALALHQTGLTAPVRRPYTAPEHGDGRTWSIAADVYSIGAIAHELLTGRRLGAAEQEGGLAALTPHQRAPVRRILATALAADPTERFHSARAFVQALETVAAAEPVLPPQPTATAVPQLAPPLPPRVTVAPPVVRPRSTPAAYFRWNATAAVAIAALLAGSAGGYAIRLRHAAAPAAASDLANTTVPVAPESLAMPQPIAPASELSGSWILTSRIEQSNVAGFHDLTLSFRLELNQDGNQLSGQGLKWAENGRPIPSRGRTPITVKGTMEGNKVVLSFTERGARRTSHGRLELQVLEDGVLDGRFSSDAARSSGHARVVRVSSP